MNLTFHKLCDVFPPMEEHEFEGLVASIGSCGQNEEIVCLGTEILDGKNRYLACKKLGIPPRVRQYDVEHDGSSLVQFVRDKNLNRRNLNRSQHAVIANELEAALRAEIPPGKKRGAGRLRDKAAAIVGVSSGAVAKAKKLSRDNPSLYEAVKDGKITLDAAIRANEEPVDEGRKLACDQFASIHGDELGEEVRNGTFLHGKWLREFLSLDRDIQHAILPLVRNGWNPLLAAKLEAGSFAETDTIDLLFRYAEWHGGSAVVEMNGFRISITNEDDDE